MKTLPFILVIAAVSGSTPGCAQSEPDVAAGKRTFGQCLACHTAAPGQADMTGPNLAGVYGSKAATRRAKFAYSAALKASGLTWDDATLDKWLTDPTKLVPGTKMEFLGISRKSARDNVIAYLKTLPK